LSWRAASGLARLSKEGESGQPGLKKSLPQAARAFLPIAESQQQKRGFAEMLVNADDLRLNHPDVSQRLSNIKLEGSLSERKTCVALLHEAELLGLATTSSS
jgi:hypothetical protein